MAIIYKLDADGGFTCGDTETRVTSYAYPTSFYATDAKRNATMAQRTAAEMIAKEPIARTAEYVREFDARNWERLGIPAGWDKVETSI